MASIIVEPVEDKTAWEKEYCVKRTRKAQQANDGKWVTIIDDSRTIKVSASDLERERAAFSAEIARFQALVEDIDNVLKEIEKIKKDGESV